MTTTQVLDFFAKGRESYTRMRFSKAADYFSAALALDLVDGYSHVHAECCKYYIQEPQAGGLERRLYDEPHIAHINWNWYTWQNGQR